jgi:nicotinamidase-related amidase
MKHMLNLVLEYYFNANIPVILVTSSYEPNQFEGIPLLCTTEQGREFELKYANQLLENCNISNVEKVGPLSFYVPEIDRTILVMTKTTNSILSCDETTSKELLSIIRDRVVLVCGVTSQSCVRVSVEALLEYCNVIYVARNIVACRESREPQETQLFNSWINDRNDNIKVWNTWSPGGLS